MAIDAYVELKTFDGTLVLGFEGGSSTVLIGANGSGKTRLGVYIDRHSHQKTFETHRISAHRVLNLNTKVIAPSLEIAINRLTIGRDNKSERMKDISRWNQNPATILLNDFDHLLAALYAEDNEVSVKFRQQALKEPISIAPLQVPKTKLDILKSIWERLLPHRELVLLSGNIKTKISGYNSGEYSASEMSDGERVIFYLIGQALVANADTVLIFDEPELHINRSITTKLWDEIEAARPDCAFVYITHDVEFAASRTGANKFALRAYRTDPEEAWDIEAIPEAENIPDDIVAIIIGSRKPVLFVEGDGGSLDASLYRRVYEGFTVVPVGSCDQVIHTVTSFASRPELHRVGCAGLIDVDGRSSQEIAHLKDRNIYCLPVSEVENLLLLPEPFLEISRALNFSEIEAKSKLEDLKKAVFEQAAEQIDNICLRYTRRKIDSDMKKIGLFSSSVKELRDEFDKSVSEIDVNMTFDEYKSLICEEISNENYENILFYYDNKGLLAKAANLLGSSRKALDEFVGRTLRSDENKGLRNALVASLPVVSSQP